MKSKLSAGCLAAFGLLLFLAGGCQSAPGYETSHWNIGSLPSRVAYRFFNYREDLDGTYREHQWREKQEINLTLRRHLLNNNPDNPFQPDDPSRVAPRPPHSILPDPIDYFHVESLTAGVCLLALTGTFVPVPIGSLLATAEPGGTAEFLEGLGNTISGSFGSRLDEPAPVEEFRVRREK
ncbi:MAG: hypothetical protein AB1726_08900 [Planctomycetota bacterium]